MIVNDVTLIKHAPHDEPSFNSILKQDGKELLRERREDGRFFYFLYVFAKWNGRRTWGV